MPNVGPRLSRVLLLPLPHRLFLRLLLHLVLIPRSRWVNFFFRHCMHSREKNIGEKLWHNFVQYKTSPMNPFWTRSLDLSIPDAIAMQAHAASTSRCRCTDHASESELHLVPGSWSPRGSSLDRIHQALADPRSTESIEPTGIPDRSSRFDRALRDPRSSPRGSPIDRVDRALGDPRKRIDVGSTMRQPT